MSVEYIPQIQLKEVHRYSHALRDKIEAVGNDVHEFSKELKKILSAANSFVRSGFTHSNMGLALSHQLSQFTMKVTSGDEPPMLSKLLHEMGAAIADVETNRQKMLKDMDYSFVKPLEFFINNDILQFEDYSGAYKTSKESYDSAIRKSSDITKRDMHRQEIEDSRLKLADVTFDYCRTLNDIQSKKKFEFLESIVNFCKTESLFYESSTHSTKKTVALEEGIRLYVAKEKEAYTKFTAENAQKRKMSVMRQDSMDILMRTTKTVNKEGFVLKKSSNPVKGWKKRFIVVRGGRLICYTDQKDTEPQKVLNLMLTTVKEYRPGDFQNCIEVISNEDSLILQTESATEMKEWVSVIQNSTLALLESQMRTSNTKQQSGDDNMTILCGIHPSNKLCAECGAPEPDWISINLGILVCIECSGVHRSLGVHISKVRSLTLDKIDSNTMEFMKSIGNHVAKSIWEATLRAPISPTSDRATKQTFIENKYRDKSYLSKFSGSQEQLDEALRSHVIQGNLHHAYHAIAVGANIDKAHLPDNKTCLHYAIEAGKIELLDLLLLNDADTSIYDKSGHTPLHRAILLGQTNTIRLLLLRGANASYPCGLGPDKDCAPVALAIRTHSESIVSLLQSHEKHSAIAPSPSPSPAPPARLVLNTSGANKASHSRHMRSPSAPISASSPNNHRPLTVLLESFTIFKKPDSKE